MDHHIADTGDLAPGEARALSVEGVEIALARSEEGDWFAIGDRCTHGAVSLADGDIEGCTLECWLHGSKFDLRTGEPIGLPATQPVPTYPVTIDGQRVLVEL